jgi:hypothetical protein
MLNVLSIGQDNLFADLPYCRTHHISTGRSITPMAQGRRLSALGLGQVFGRLAAGKYDLIVLPAVDLANRHVETTTKRLLRLFVDVALRRRVIVSAINWILARGNTKVIVLDRYDSIEPMLAFLDSVPSAQLYFKTNLLRSDEGRVHKPQAGGSCEFRLLPYWVATESYAARTFQLDHSEKDTDTFFAGTLNSAARRESISLLQSLSSAGYRVKIFEGRSLNFEQYLTMMSRSWLTLSPEGHGFNGFRHYEAMLVGSIPLINEPSADILHDFEDGKNCFLYSLERGNVAAIARRALADKGNLLRMAEESSRWVLERHSQSSVGRYLLRQATVESPCTRHSSPLRLRCWT